MGLWQDFQFALRLLVKDKWFTLVATLALGIGIGVNTSVFTFVNAVLIRGLPFEDADRILAIMSHDPVRDRTMPTSYLDYKDWRDATKTFSTVASYIGGTMNVSDEGRVPERYSGAYVTHNTFRLVGEPPRLGRDFLPEDDRPGAPAVVLLSDTLWKNRYGSDPAIVGRSIRVNDAPSIVIGVMPEGLRFPFNTDVWQPLAAIPTLETQTRSQRGLEVIGRLAPGASREHAEAELATITQALAQQYPDSNKDIGARLQTMIERSNGGPIRAVFLSLMGAVGFVLLIACANVANLLLSRSAHRSREIAVRVSLGATRQRVIRQLLVESVLLAVIAGVIGFALSLWGIRLFDVATQDNRPYWIQFTMDARVFAYLAAICLGTSFIFGLAPALHVSKTDVNDLLKEGGRSGSAGMRVQRWSGVLIVGEIALTLALLAGAGFMTRNFLTMYRLDLGVDTTQLLTVNLSLPDRKYPSIEQRLAFYQQLQQRLEANGRFTAVSVVSNPPAQGGLGRLLTIDRRTLAQGEQRPSVTMITVDPRYFTTVGVPLVRGRGFTAQDGSPGQEHAIVNARFAEMYFANEDPIGRQIELAIDLGGASPPNDGIRTSLKAIIIGIVGNVRQRSVNETQFDAIAYLPYRVDPRAFMTLIARAEGDPRALTPLLREEIRAIDADLPLFNIRTMDEILAQMRWPFRVFGTMFAFFAFVALMLSAIGLYAVTAYSVTQRTQEIGVRTALGAVSSQVMWMFLRRAFIQLGIGLTIGVAGAFGVGAIFESAGLLIQTNGRDPIIISSIALLLAVVALAACLFPAHRATRLDPIVALRRD